MQSCFRDLCLILLTGSYLSNPPRQISFESPEAIQRAIAVFATLSNINYTETRPRPRPDRDTIEIRVWVERFFFQVARHVVRHSVALLTNTGKIPNQLYTHTFPTRSKDLTPLGQANETQMEYWGTRYWAPAYFRRSLRFGTSHAK